MPSLFPSDDIFVVIKSLLASRVNSTLGELSRDYEDKVGDNRLPRNFKDLRRLMLTVPEVQCIKNDYGLEMWQVKQPKIIERKSQINYMKKDKHRASSGGPYDPKSLAKAPKRAPSSSASSRASSFTKSQPQSKRQRCHADIVNHNLSHMRVIDMDGYYGEYQLMGDDFLLSVAKIDLRYKFTKYLDTATLRIGYCISGLTIKALSRIVRSSAHINDRVILYIGSVDILNGRDLNSIICDFYDLMSSFRERGIEPNICTLAPISDPDYNYDGIINGLNGWLLSRKWSVIDINDCFVDAKAKAIRSYYQKDPRNVSGTNLRHLLWNRLGRGKFIKCLKNFTGIYSNY